jgi:hypothetical protein
MVRKRSEIALACEHLGALALAGDADRLKFHQDAFERGERLGCVPYISKQMIDRALQIAEQNKQIGQEPSCADRHPSVQFRLNGPAPLEHPAPAPDPGD